MSGIYNEYWERREVLKGKIKLLILCYRGKISKQDYDQACTILDQLAEEARKV